MNELYERSGNINCTKHDLVNKQIDTDGRQLDSKLCDLIYLLVSLILSHNLAKREICLIYAYELKVSASCLMNLFIKPRSTFIEII